MENHAYNCPMALNLKPVNSNSGLNLKVKDVKVIFKSSQLIKYNVT
jgi:hypothetical protein